MHAAARSLQSHQVLKSSRYSVKSTRALQLSSPRVHQLPGSRKTLLVVNLVDVSSKEEQPSNPPNLNKNSPLKKQTFLDRLHFIEAQVGLALVRAVQEFIFGALALVKAITRLVTHLNNNYGSSSLESKKVITLPPYLSLITTVRQALLNDNGSLESKESALKQTKASSAKEKLFEATCRRAGAMSRAEEKEASIDVVATEEALFAQVFAEVYDELNARDGKPSFNGSY